MHSMRGSLDEQEFTHIRIVKVSLDTVSVGIHMLFTHLCIRHSFICFSSLTSIQVSTEEEPGLVTTI